jgi:membrane-bound lytic murein transglycosylase B
VRRFRVIRAPDSVAPSVPVPSAGERRDQASRPPDGVSSTRTARTLILPILLVGCLGALVLPAADAVPYAVRPATSVPQAAAAMLLPPGLVVDSEAVADERPPTRSFIATPAAVSTDPAVSAPVDGAAPVDTAAVEAQAAQALSGPAGVTDGATGIPVTVLAAYRKAEALLAAAKPSCHLPWWLVAGVGRIETGHAFGGRVDANGNTRGRIMGPLLDGSMPGTAVIRDTDGGKWDGNATFDRGIGPMGFLPGSWTEWGKDGNGDKVADPNNVFDAATAAGYVLCSVGDLSTPAMMGKALLRYNHSASYVELVLKWAATYRDGVTPTADSTATVPAVATRPTTTPPPAPTTSTPPPATTTAPPKPSTSSPTSSTTSSNPPPSTTTAPPSTTTAPPSTTTTAPPSTTTTPPETTTNAAAETTTSG